MRKFTIHHDAPVLEIKHVTNRFGSQIVHDDISFNINRGEIIGLVGGSGAGKSVMLRTMTGLRPPSKGEVWMMGEPINKISPTERASLFGVLFQEGALFSSMTVAENIIMPLREHTNLPESECMQLACYKLKLVGLDSSVGEKYPSELSGGMTKRVGIARALALDPPILFLDEPTSGLDPISAHAFDELVRMLNETLGVTIIMITHDLDSLFGVCDRVAMLVDKKITLSTIPELLDNQHPWIHEYLHGARAYGAMIATQGESHGE